MHATTNASVSVNPSLLRCTEHICKISSSQRGAISTSGVAYGRSCREWVHAEYEETNPGRQPFVPLNHHTAFQRQRLNHLVDELGDVLLAVAGVTALDVAGELPGAPAAGGVRQLEGPEAGGDLLEVGAAGGDLVNEVLNADNAELAELLLDDRVVGDGDALAADLGVSALVDKLADGLEVGLTVGDVGLNEAEHLLGGLGHANEDTVVDLEEAEELEDLLGLGGKLGDTLKTNNEVDLGLGSDVVVAGLAGLALEADLLLLLGEVLLDVLVGTLEDDLALGLAGL